MSGCSSNSKSNYDASSIVSIFRLRSVAHDPFHQQMGYRRAIILRVNGLAMDRAQSVDFRRVTKKKIAIAYCNRVNTSSYVD